VDNASEPENSNTLRHLCNIYGFLYLLEEELGLSNARNRAIKAAKGHYIYFIDDDAVAPSHLLETVINCFDEIDCDIMGGPVHGLWEQTPPRWLGSRYWRALSLVSYGPNRRSLRYPEIPLGCNIAFKKSIFEQFGNFRSDLGRMGKSLIGHEEREILQRVMNAGKVVYYEPRAYVFHNVSVGRMHVEYFHNRLSASSDSACRMTHGVNSKENLSQRLTSFTYGQFLSIYHAIIFAIEFYLFETRLRWGIERRKNENRNSKNSQHENRSRERSFKGNL
jgi:GT2 family glycosyltransferase